MNTDDTPKLQQLRWCKPALVFLFISTIVALWAAFSDSGLDQTKLLTTAIVLAVAFCLVAIYFSLMLFFHFVAGTETSTWIWVLAVLAIITTLGIAALLFALFLIFGYYPEELERELEVALPEKELESKFLSIRENLEKISIMFSVSSGNNSENIRKIIIDDAILSNPEQVKKVGRDGLVTLKTEVNNIISTISELVVKNIKSDVNWPHQSVPSSSVEEIEVVDRNSLRASINQILSIELGLLGAMLVKNGFAKIGHFAKWVPIENTERVRYRENLEWSKEMTDRFDEYCTTYNKLTRIHDALKKIRQRREGDEVKRLWESS